MIFNTADDAFSYIESFTNLEKTPNLTAREYRLDRMFVLLELFDSPQKEFKSIHVAGSKGKGSTAAYIAAALKANGFRTGLYCSPHVTTYKERISLSGDFFEDKTYAKTAEMMFKRIEEEGDIENFPGGPPTTFEFLTLLAFLIFREEECEWAVFETGLGGRLDATNVIVPEASVLTVIELEHTEYLGDTIADIAGEKAGIIKPGIPVFSAAVKPEAEAVFRCRAADAGSEIFFPEDQIKSISPVSPAAGCSQAYNLVLKNDATFKIELAAAGEFQIKNASLAVRVLNQIMQPGFIADAGISETVLPGRMEMIRTSEMKQPVLLDGAHTVESVRSAVRSFMMLNKADADKEAALIFGAVEGKDIKGMAVELRGFKHIIISTPGTFKKSSPESVFKIVKEALYGTAETESPDIQLIKSPEDALSAAIATDLAVLVTGSFYMVAEIRKILLPDEK
ncbi:MAG: Mur ligase family protein [Spirochaetales bacterium]|uniref:Dihydrofolate synthase/folylpolyglutamate synthase n=1 Tax=Candidatus Thalassospirochaeta sargassi TaxID=3119039 RepID=A0AAJ1IDL9_9SPIO|nr:Mur ligase family protein [Spirochaetales bacterium]